MKIVRRSLPSRKARISVGWTDTTKKIILFLPKWAMPRAASFKELKIVTQRIDALHIKSFGIASPILPNA